MLNVRQEKYSVQAASKTHHNTVDDGSIKFYGATTKELEKYVLVEAIWISDEAGL